MARIHKRPRRSMFTPEHSDCPVPLNRLNGTRVTHRDFGKGNVEMTEDVNYNQIKDPNQRSKQRWKGKTVFPIETACPKHDKQTCKDQAGTTKDGIETGH